MIYKVLFLSAIWCLFIQQPFNKSEQSKGSYFDSIYSAEEFIICQDYKSALKIYSDLFENYDSPRGFDYYNAALCAVYCNNNKSFLIFVQQCIEKGFRFDFIESILKEHFKLDKELLFQIERNSDSLYRNYSSHKDEGGIQEIKEMLKEDQLYSYKLMMDEFPQSKVDSLYLKNILQLVGLMQNDSLLNVEAFSLESKHMRSFIPVIILRHYFGFLNRAIYFPNEYFGEIYSEVIDTSKYIEEELVKQISKGRLSPVLISMSSTYSHPDDIYGKLGENYGRYITTDEDIDIMVEYVRTRKNYSEGEIEQINNNRKKWNLPTFNHSMRLSNYYNLLPDSIRPYYHSNNINEYFILTGELLANEFYLDDYKDSVTFHIDYESNLKDKLGLELDWFYLGIENGRVLPK